MQIKIASCISSQNPSDRVQNVAFFNKMMLPRLLPVLVLVDTLSGVFSCGATELCKWNTCTHEWRNYWSPGISTGQCVNQHRNAHHKYTTQEEDSAPCPSPVACSPSTQYRTMCKYDHRSLLIMNSSVYRNFSDETFAFSQLDAILFLFVALKHFSWRYREVFFLRLKLSSSNNFKTKLVKDYDHFERNGFLPDRSWRTRPVILSFT